MSMTGVESIFQRHRAKFTEDNLPYDKARFLEDNLPHYRPPLCWIIYNMINPGSKRAIYHMIRTEGKATF